MEDPNPKKRHCENPIADFNENDVDQIVSSFLSLPDMHSLSSSLSIECSLDQVLEKLFVACDDDRLIDRICKLGSILHESVERYSRKRIALHNSASWLLPRELTVKVFSKLDTKSLMQVMACCTMFNECAMEPFCYSHIDLTTAFPFADDRVVYTMIQRARNELRRLLRSLHLYNLRCLNNSSLRDTLLQSPNLTNLKIVGVDKNVRQIGDVLEYLPNKCEHLFIEKEIGSSRASSLYVTSLGSDNITSLSLIGLIMEDSTAYFLLNNLRKLKYMNLSRSFGISGSFLSDDYGNTLLETLILRDCFTLEERPVLMFLDSLLEENFKFIHHIDVSNNHGLASDGTRSFKPKFPLEMLKRERPGLTFLAVFPLTSYYSSDEEEEKDLNLRRNIPDSISWQIDSILSIRFSDRSIQQLFQSCRH